MVATAMTAAAAASERRRGEARARVLHTALDTVAGRARGAGRELRWRMIVAVVVHVGDVAEGAAAGTDFDGAHSLLGASRGVSSWAVGVGLGRRAHS